MDTLQEVLDKKLSTFNSIIALLRVKYTDLTYAEENEISRYLALYLKLRLNNSAIDARNKIFEKFNTTSPRPTKLTSGVLNEVLVMWMWAQDGGRLMWANDDGRLG